MKQTEINRLREICEKEGFTINEINNGISQFFQIDKKDEWEGVEFAEYIGERSNYFTTGKIYPLNTSEEDILYIKFDDEGDSHEEYTEFFKPSTEQAYKDQLTQEAKERFGEIKVGDKFIGPDGREITIIGAYGLSFKYNKSIDALFFNAYAIYAEGKWATKITKTEIKVEYTGWEYQGRLDSAVNIGFKVPNNFVMSIRLGELMAEFIKTHIENEKTC